jgi:hypothetical protein
MTCGYICPGIKVVVVIVIRVDEPRVGVETGVINAIKR